MENATDGANVRFPPPLFYVAGLALGVAVLAVVQKQVIAREEAYLERAFGSEYVAYRNQVRRWI